MSYKEEIWRELMEISPVVANLQKAPVYSVPYSYFDNLAQHILQKVKDEGEQVYGDSTEMPYAVPHQYFENLAEGILQKIKTGQNAAGVANEVYQELEEVAPLLNSISKEDVYSLPVFYFENNLSTMPTEALVSAKVVRMSAVRKFATYAAAAAVTGIIAIGSFLYLNKETPSATKPAVAGPLVTSAVKQLSDEEIIEYLENNTPAIDVTAAAYKTPHTDTNIEEYLDEMTDEEIRQYLNETAEPGDKILKEINS